MALPSAAVITKKVILPGNQRDEDMEVQVRMFDQLRDEVFAYSLHTAVDLFGVIGVIGPGGAGLWSRNASARARR